MVRLKTALLGAFLLSFMAVTGYAATQKMMWVQVQGGQVRSTPSFLGKILIRLSYGEQVEVQEERAAWARVTPVGRDREGWIHISALTKKKIVLKPGQRRYSRPPPVTSWHWPVRDSTRGSKKNSNQKTGMWITPGLTEWKESMCLRNRFSNF